MEFGRGRMPVPLVSARPSGGFSAAARRRILAQLIPEFTVAGLVEVNFTHPLLLAKNFDVFPEPLADLHRVFDGGEDGVGMGAVGGFQNDIAKPEEP